MVVMETRKVPEAFCCCGRHGNTHAHQVSPPCMLQLASLKGEEVVLKLFVVVVVMEMK